MKRAIRKAALLISSALIIGLVCAGCESERDRQAEANKLKSIQTCEDTGGIAILSILDGRLTDCIYPQTSKAN